MALILNEFFVSVFTIENISAIPKVDGQTTILKINSNFVVIIVTNKDVAQQIHLQTRPDEIYPKHLEELKKVLFNRLVFIFY